MRTAMRPRYYCDFCKRGSGSPSAMRRHEAGCTIRPDRRCGMCGQDGHDGFQVPLVELFPFALAADVPGLRAAAHGCPACMLAAIRQAPWPTKFVESDTWGEGYSFKEIPEAIANWKFEDEKKTFWAEVNETRREDMSGYAYY